MLLFGKDIPIRFFIDESVPKFFYIFSEVFIIGLFVFSKAAYFDGEKFLRGLSIGHDILRLLDISPKFLHIILNFSTDFSLLVILIIEVSHAEKNRFRRLMLKLGNAYLHNDLEGFVL